VDEPVNTGGTLARAVALLRDRGFSLTDQVALFPVHPHRREWASGPHQFRASGVRCLSLEPEDWHKRQLLSSSVVTRRLREYFEGSGYRHLEVVPGRRADEYNAWMEELSEQKFHSRLKRVYELRLQTSEGRLERRYVFAKSVGWGWLGYHAFLAAETLAEFVPPLYGLRDGILLSEWLPQDESDQGLRSAPTSPGRLGAYIATRARSLALPGDPGPDLCREGRHPGFEDLMEALLGAYWLRPVRALRKGRLRRELARLRCPVPSLIDGKMGRIEWIGAGNALLKTDFEQHGLGKTELNVTDPAFDIAQATLHFGLNQDQEAELIARYIADSGDHRVRERLFLNKLLAGTASMNNALANLGDARLSRRRQVYHRQYLDAWNYLILQTTRFAASLCASPRPVCWGNGVVVLDVDGVLDRMLFGFPSTTRAGIRAMSLLHAHGRPVALNTARTLREVKEYSRAYGLLGGVAEYGSCVWDAVGDRKRVLVSDATLRELAVLRDALRDVPGVFLNEDYEYSLRVYTYDGGRTAPLPGLVLQNQIGMLGLTRLQTHRTYLDTAVVAKEVDKGAGLAALLDLAGCAAAEVTVVGDSEADLPMFRFAGRSFAPGHISCGAAARALGCRIAKRPYQAGFLESVRRLLHPDGESCEACRSADGSRLASADLILRLLGTADEAPLFQAVRALLDPAALELFRD
jgi:hydroxymethylpyrimidine pyrophosphatase-like HAD family hydrolase